MTIAEVDDSIRRLVEAINATAPGNQWRIDELRPWLAAHLADHADEVQRFPRLAHQPHWDLSMADHDVHASASFLVALFAGDEVHFAGGRGVATRVREFADNDFPDDPARVIAELRRRFAGTSEPLVLSRTAFDRWLFG